MNKKNILIAFVITLLMVFILPNNVEASVKINETSITMVKGRTTTLKISETKEEVTWSSSNSKIATVNESGKVFAKKKGSCTISASVDGKVYKCKVKVGNKIGASSTNVKLNGDKIKSVQITYVDKGTLSYSIEDNDIVSAEWAEDWKKDKIKLYLTGKKNGSTYITISSDTTSEKIKMKVTVTGFTEPEDLVKIELPEVPKTINRYHYYTDKIEQSFEVTKVYYDVKYYEFKDSYTVTLHFDGTKTYDEKGAGQSSECFIGWKLYDGENFVVDSGTAISSGVSNGEKFKSADSYIYDLEKGKYRLEILSTN